MRNLFISYDLNAPGQRYDKVSEVIKGLGNWAKVQKSMWFVSTSLSAADAANRVWRAMDSSDSLIVIDTVSNEAAWMGLAPDVSRFIQDHWQHSR